jgi:hypothetical protein
MIARVLLTVLATWLILSALTAVAWAALLRGGAQGERAQGVVHEQL